MSEKTLINDLCDISALDTNQIEENISSIIKEAGLNKSNKFFLRAQKIQKIDINSAFNIAYNWREITKTFLFTTISGLGYLSDKVGNEQHPNSQLLGVMQTSLRIISDDLGNNNTNFRGSPCGTNAIHYRWWEDSILTPLKGYLDIKAVILAPGTIILTNKMRELSNNYLGVAVQLRVVEAIAKNICLAFLPIFSKVEYEGKKIFKPKKDLTWILAHIKAETFHHKQVCDKNSGMTQVAVTLEHKKDILMLIHEYACIWANALDNLADFL